MRFHTHLTILIRQSDKHYYRIISENDERLCRVCSGQDGSVYPAEDAKAGVNFPPFHPNCWCTVEWFNDGYSEELLASLGYDPSFLEELEELLKGIYNGLQSRANNAFNDFESFLDWLTMGIPKGLLDHSLSNAERMLGDPNWYTIFNWLSIGALDAISGTINPERPL